MVPGWLEILARVSLALAFLSFVIILFDILVLGQRQKMAIMNAVWPVTALYFGPFALWAYWSMGRVPSRLAQHQQRDPGSRAESGGGQQGGGSHSHGQGHQRGPFWQSVFISDSHCGAGCTLGDVAGEWLIFMTATTIHGVLLWPQFIVDYAFAFVLGIAFQYFAIVPMRGLSPGQGIIAALRADTLSLTFFEIGLFGWMALMRFVLFVPPIHPDSWVYWFTMQIGMALGFATSYPVNWFLVRSGLKESM